jgi:hypothetical protein
MFRSFFGKTSSKTKDDNSLAILQLGSHPSFDSSPYETYPTNSKEATKHPDATANPIGLKTFKDPYGADIE